MSRSRKSLVAVGVLSGVIIGLLLLGAPVATQGQGPKGGGETETAGNNLSYPVIFLDTALTLREPPVGLDYSLYGSYYYGWEVIGTDGAITQNACEITAADCPPSTAVDPYRVYIQKNDLSVWQAYHGTASTAVADYLDWADNLEYQTWTASSVVRIETVPFAATTGTPSFEMAFVSGSGTDEIWGLRAKFLGEVLNPDDPLEKEHGVPEDATFSYGYATLYSANASLTLQKLEKGEGTISLPPDTGDWVWDGANHVWEIPADPAVEGSTDVVPFTAIVVPYTAEINVTGKAIYGYNWQLRSTVMTAGDSKGGWWRLTFSTAPNAEGAYPIQFSTGTLPTPPGGASATESQQLFYPQFDTTNHITYIDIFLAPAKGGGKRVR